MREEKLLYKIKWVSALLMSLLFFGLYDIVEAQDIGSNLGQLRDYTPGSPMTTTGTTSTQNYTNNAASSSSFDPYMGSNQGSLRNYTSPATQTSGGTSTAIVRYYTVSTNSVCAERKDKPYNQCGGTVGLESYPSNHTYAITRVRDCYGNILRYEKPVDLGVHANQCGNNASGQPEMYVTCNNRVITRQTLIDELKGANYPGPWGDAQVELAAFNRAACPTAKVAAAATKTPAQTQSQTVNVSTTKDTSEPAVTTKGGIEASDELPRTGPLALGIILTALAPIGWKIKKFGLSKDNNFDPTFIWNKRELSK